jgi:hypothetical protein
MEVAGEHPRHEGAATEVHRPVHWFSGRTGPDLGDAVTVDDDCRVVDRRSPTIE